MFFSTDLLCVRGGKFGTIWLLATTRDRKAVVKKKKAEILKTNMAQLCQELTKMFPVQGKEKSFSLRTSSILMYGTCINLRLISEDLRRAVLLLLSLRPTTGSGKTGGGIDLPGGQMSSHLARLEVPTEADIDMGNIQWTDVGDVFSQVDFRVRESDITMREHPTVGLEYEGQELPLLTINDILTESWSLEDKGQEGDQERGQSRTRCIPPSNVSPSPKRARLVEPQEQSEIRVEEQLGEAAIPVEVTTMEQQRGDDLEAGAPVRPRVPSVPSIEVTPAVELESRKKITPTMLDMEAVAGEDTLPLPPSPLPAMEDVPPPNIPSPDPEAVEEANSQLELQPLVPAPVKKPRLRPGKGKQGLVWVDMETQVSSDSIRQGLHNYEDTMRVRDVAMDLARRLPRPPVVFTAPGRELGMALSDVFKEAARLAAVGGEVSWDWVVERRVEEERENTAGEVSVEASGQGSRLGDRNISGSFLGAPQAESSRIDPDQGKTMVDGQLEDIREQVEEDILPPVGGVDLTPVVPEEGMEVENVETNQQEDANQQANQLEGDGREMLPPGGFLHQTTVEGDNVEGNLQDMQLQDDPDHLLAQPHVSPPQQEDLGLQEMMVGGHHDHLGQPPLSPSPTVTQFTVHSKLSQLSAGQDSCFFTDLFPPTSTSRREAATTFFHLLQMEKEKKVSTSQEEMYGPIQITMTEV